MAVMVALMVVQIAARHQLAGRLESFASSKTSLKMTGNLLQTAAFDDPGILPLYGSSELDHRAGNRPDLFFRTRPTGFDAFPIGHAGSTCLMILQKLAAVGHAACKKKVVIFLSPSWFTHQEVAGRAVAANLPAAEVGAWVFNSPLDGAIKRKIARRLLDYPESMNGQPLLNSAIHALADTSLPPRLILGTLWLPGVAQVWISRGIESCLLLWEIHRHPERTQRHSFATVRPAKSFDWRALAEHAETRDRSRGDGTFYSATLHDAIGAQRNAIIDVQKYGSRDASFSEKLGLSKEWQDLKLLTLVLKDFKMDAVLISQPFNGSYNDLRGTTRMGRRIYYQMLTSIIGPSGFTLLDYSEHEPDRFFFNDAGHPSAKAWIYYDQALDRFYHSKHDAGIQP